ncbi:MAG: hypothetical protein ACRYGC_08750 [Janthinobacterium lividum]
MAIDNATHALAEHGTTTPRTARNPIAASPPGGAVSPLRAGTPPSKAGHPAHA